MWPVGDATAISGWRPLAPVTAPSRLVTLNGDRFRRTE
jgi:hypothetical protein